MTMLSNKTIVRDYIDQVWTKRNLAAVDEYIAADYIQHAHGTPPGREGVKGFFSMLNSAFSELGYKVEDMVAEADKVCWSWILRAKHTGAFQGVPATGKSIAITGISLVRLADGKFVEHWGEQDMLGLMQQLRGQK
jgi:steroid delta-isomerase-like uncharacterized protein